MIIILKAKSKLSLSNFKGSHYLTCPSCGKKRLKLYCYEDGKELHESVGRCQRESNCGYHLKPAEYFKDKGEKYVNSMEFVKPIPKLIYSLNRAMCEKIASNFKKSTLLTFLAQTGIDYSPIFERYKVGSSPNGSTVFFQFDGVKFRAGKIIKYLPDGHRDKSDGMPIAWIHKAIPDFDEKTHEIQQCFFGMHLLNKDKIVCVVESEKTAVICSGVFPSAVWMATGGRTQLNEYGLTQLSKVKKVLLFPDDDSIELWSKKTKAFGNCKIVDLSEFNDNKKKGADLADYLLNGSNSVVSGVINKVSKLLTTL